MSSKAAFRLLLLFPLFVTLSAFATNRWARLTPVDGPHFLTGWDHGVFVARSDGDYATGLLAARARDGIAIVKERVIAEGNILAGPPGLLAFSLVPGVDGVRATLAGETAFVTPDELLAASAYERQFTLDALHLSVGADEKWIYARLAEKLQTSSEEVRRYARFRRIRVERASGWSNVSPSSFSSDDARHAARSAALHLARGVTAEGRFRYLVDAVPNRDEPGYSLSRHAGATFFLAQAASHFPDEVLKEKAREAARHLADQLASCGPGACVSDGDAPVNPSALALLAFTELALRNIDASFVPRANALATFLRSQQRPDGEFQHGFEDGRPRDIQRPYASGEAALALSRHHRLSHDPNDLDAARRAVLYLTGPGWRFFGDRYFYGEEHWTAIALGDLWDRSPLPEALEFCVRWHAYGAALQYGEHDAPLGAAGGYGVGPFVAPRLPLAASRAEALAATLRIVRQQHDDRLAAELEAQLRRALAFLASHQWSPGPAHLLADPAAIHGAFPQSPVDWHLRIDFAQHAGSAFVAWLELNGGD